MQPAPVPFIRRVIRPTNNKKSNLFSHLVTSHLSLVIAYFCGIMLPVAITNLAMVSVFVQLLVWTDTTGADQAAHKARCQLRDIVAECLCLFHILLITFYTPLPAWPRFALMAVECTSYLVMTAIHSMNLHQPKTKPRGAGGTLSKPSRRPSKGNAHGQTPQFFSWFSSSKRNKEDTMPPYENLREINRRSPSPETP